MAVERIVQSGIGSLRVVVHGPASAVVFAEGATVNRVSGLNIRVDIAANKSPHSALPLGAPWAAHTGVRKAGDFNWEPSWNLREKVDTTALAVFNSLLADDAFAAEVNLDVANREVESAQREFDRLRQELAEAEAALGAALTGQDKAQRVMDRMEFERA